MTQTANVPKCSNPECDRDGICRERGSDKPWCVICRPRETVGPCDKAVMVKDDQTDEPREQPCGSTEDVIRFRTPNGTALQRCERHRRPHDIINEPGLGYM